MKSSVEVMIDAPRERVADLLVDPANIPRWMDDVERYEPLSGTPGSPGSTYRLVPKTGSMIFITTVEEADREGDVRLRLEEPELVVEVTDKLASLTPDTTRLISTEVFRFKGLLKRLLGLFALGAIRKAHRRHMEAFKRFAESRFAEARQAESGAGSR